MFEIIRKHKPAVLGVQEALKFQNDELLHTLHDMNFDMIGVGRQGGDNSEFCSIFYHRDRFSVQSSGTFWLCDHPNLEGGRTYGNRLPRICTWALFRDKLSKNREFYLYNTHLDHESANARHRGALQILESVKVQRGKFFKRELFNLF